MTQVLDRFRSSTWGWLRGTLAGWGTLLLCLVGTDAQAQQVAANTSETGISRQIDGTPVWIVPPSGFSPASGISGFIDMEGASIVAIKLPASAFRSLPNELKRGTILGNGRRITADGEQWQLEGGVTGIHVEVEDTSSSELIRAHMLMIHLGESMIIVIAAMPEGVSVSSYTMMTALRSVRIGDPPTSEQQLSALDFTIGDQAGLRFIQAMSVSGAAAFTDGPLDVDPTHLQPLVVIGLEPAIKDIDSSSAQSYANDLLNRSFPGATIISSHYDPALRRHRFEAKGQDDGVAMRYVQVISFGPQANLRIVCAYRADLNFIDRCLQVAGSTTRRH